MDAPDLRKLRDAFRLKPVEEFRRRAGIGAARVRVSDLRREEFEEAIGRARASGRYEGRGARGRDGGEPIHESSRFGRSCGGKRLRESCTHKVVTPSFSHSASASRYA
jgi:hypothetical protein